METLWLKIKSWTKIVIFSLLVIYLLLFTYNNYGQELKIWWWFGEEIKTTVLELTAALLLIGVLGTLVVRMAFRAVKQIRELRARSAAAKMQRDVAEIKAKADMMQTRPVPGKSE